MNKKGSESSAKTNVVDKPKVKGTMNAKSSISVTKANEPKKGVGKAIGSVNNVSEGRTGMSKQNSGISSSNISNSPKVTTTPVKRISQQRYDVHKQAEVLTLNQKHKT